METVTQRRVPASAAGMLKPAGVPSSVFDAGRQAKEEAQRTRPAIDPAQVEIRKGVPLPPDRRGRGSKYLTLLRRMSAGDSVVLSNREALSMVSAAKKAGIKVAARALNESQRGVWRL